MTTNRVALTYRGNPTTSEATYYIGTRGRPMARVDTADGRIFRYRLNLDGSFALAQRKLGTWCHLYAGTTLERLEQSPVARAIREAHQYAPLTGPVAPELAGVWVPESALAEWFVCAPCVGRITARGCGHIIRGTQVWRDKPPVVTGVCVCCGQ